MSDVPVSFSGIVLEHGTEKEEQKLNFAYMTYFKLIYVSVFKFLFFVCGRVDICVCILCARWWVCIFLINNQVSSQGC